MDKIKMKFPERYIQRGKSVLSKRLEPDIHYDINSLVTDPFWAKKIIETVPEYPHYIGIAIGGTIIAAMLWTERKNRSIFSMVKDEKLNGDVPDSNYLLIEGVITAREPINRAIEIIGTPPTEIFVTLDRRQNKTNFGDLKVTSMFQT